MFPWREGGTTAKTCHRREKMAFGQNVTWLKSLAFTVHTERVLTRRTSRGATSTQPTELWFYTHEADGGCVCVFVCGYLFLGGRWEVWKTSMTNMMTMQVKSSLRNTSNFVYVGVCWLVNALWLKYIYTERKGERKMNIKTPERQTSKKDNIGVETRSLWQHCLRPSRLCDVNSVSACRRQTVFVTLMRHPGNPGSCLIEEMWLVWHGKGSSYHDFSKNSCTLQLHKRSHYSMMHAHTHARSTHKNIEGLGNVCVRVQVGAQMCLSTRDKVSRRMSRWKIWEQIR